MSIKCNLPMLCEFTFIWCWSTPACTAPAADAVQQLTQELDLHVRDVNCDDALFYENMNNQLIMNLSTLASQYNKLVWDYNFLKDCYVFTVAQKNELVL